MTQDVKENAFIIIANILNNKLKIIVVLIVMNNLLICLQNYAQLIALDVFFC